MRKVKLNIDILSKGEWHNSQKYFLRSDQIGSVTAMVDTQAKVAGTALQPVRRQIAAKPRRTSQ